jgi:lantibiotic modifying enzyme
VERVVSRLAELMLTAGAGVEWSSFTDIISGSAGTGLFLLHAVRSVPSTDAMSMAHRAGARLLELAKPVGSRGLMWEPSPHLRRNYPNFAHGTAGVAYFLARLAKVTGDASLLDAALGGARYLQSIATTLGDVCLVFHDEPGEAGRHLFYLGYCNGPVGTARLWYQLYTSTGDRDWLAWVERSARGVLTSGIPERETPGFWNNVGVCCGSAGVASFFLTLHQVTGKAEYLAFARRMTQQLVSKATRDSAGTRWAQVEYRVHPERLVAQTGWMQGAAGIGAWLLQLDAFDRNGPACTRFPDDPFF